MENYYTNKKQEKLDFKQIILGHYKKILEISTVEYHGGYTKYGAGQDASTEYITDKRKEFIQAVETLALALYPHFDKEMKKVYTIFLNDDKLLHKKYADADGFIRGHEDENNKVKHSIKRLELMQDLFRDLGSLMFRLDCFKTSAYSEGDVDFIDVDSSGKQDKDVQEE